MGLTPLHIATHEIGHAAVLVALNQGFSRIECDEHRGALVRENIDWVFLLGEGVDERETRPFAAVMFLALSEAGGAAATLEGHPATPKSQRDRVVWQHGLELLDRANASRDVFVNLARDFVRIACSKYGHRFRAAAEVLVEKGTLTHGDVYELLTEKPFEQDPTKRPYFGLRIFPMKEDPRRVFVAWYLNARVAASSE